MDDNRLVLERVTLETPNGARTLVKELSLELEGGQGLVIVGASGGGKSSLLRAIAGLWMRGHGSIRRPGGRDMLFLPQRPYMISGTLREQLLYPNRERDVSERDLTALLARVNLPNVAERCGGFDVKLDFAKTLSVGEQQRLAVARALLAKPRYVVLDEATSALDSHNEEQLYGELRQLGATLISVTHHPSLLAYHERVLELDGEGGWSLHDARSYSFGTDLVVQAPAPANEPARTRQARRSWTLSGLHRVDLPRP